MEITAIIRRRTFLALLLLLATATTKIVEAKGSFAGTGVSSSSYRAPVGRNLENAGNQLEGVVGDNVGKDNSETSYVPYANGTAVRFQDQDGTWMLGVIWKYNSSTQTYTIQWDEDNVHEDFSDLEKVEELVLNAEKFPTYAREQQEAYIENPDYDGEAPADFDFGYTYSYQDLSDYDPWPIGTETLLEFADGWYEGKITSFSMSDDFKNATYVVTWSDGTADSFVNELEWMDLMVANAEDYEPWEIGTPTYGYPNPDEAQITANPYLLGEITKYENGAYTVTWSNGDTVVYSDFDMMDQFVNNAGMHIDPSLMDRYSPWPKGTPVSWDFDDGWWDGTITDFSDGTYEITWSDGSSKFYSNLEKIDQMVNFASGGGFLGNLANPETQDDDYVEYDDNNMYKDYYGLKTVVYAEFSDGWWAGYIDSYQNEYYVIRWSDDSVDMFLPGEDMDEMVINGQSVPEDYGIWPVGTHVYSKFDGVWYFGTIDESRGGFYTVLWDDGSRTTYVSGAEIDEMVNNANRTGMSPFGKFAIAIFALGCVGGIAFFFVRRKNRKQQELTDLTEQVRENELDLDEGNESEYTDHPIDGEPRLV